MILLFGSDHSVRDSRALLLRCQGNDVSEHWVLGQAEETMRRRSVELVVMCDGSTHGEEAALLKSMQKYRPEAKAIQIGTIEVDRSAQILNGIILCDTNPKSILATVKKLLTN